jgi:hypothetical protein
MARQGRRSGQAAPVLAESSATQSGAAAKMAPENSRMVRESPETAETVSPTETEIAAVAYQLWLNHGRPVGTDRADWFQAEAMLKDTRVTKSEDLAGHSTISQCDTVAGSEILLQFRWEGHWEVWESEWGGARWFWDLGRSRH